MIEPQPSATREALWFGSRNQRFSDRNSRKQALLVVRIPDTVIQAILRHTDVGTTQRFYIKTVREDVKDAMKQLERKIHRAAVVQQPEPTGLVN